MSETGWRNEAVDVRFDVVDGGFRFVSTMSPVTHARGSGVLRGNRFDLNVSEARFNNLAVTAGRVEVPRFKPGGGHAIIAGRAQGEARHMIAILLQEPINLRDRLPINADTATGTGVASLTLHAPMMHDAPFSAWRFNIEGQIDNFGGAMAGRDVQLSNGQLNIRGDQRAVVVSGPVRAGASDIGEVRWTEHIDDGGPSRSEYVIAGVFDARDLEQLGYPVSSVAQGRIGVTVSGEGRGFDVDRAQVELDLTNAAVTAPRRFWVKPAGAAASARFNVARASEGGLDFSGIDARGAGLFAQGSARLGRDNALIEANVTRLVVDGRTNARVAAVRGADGGYDVTVRGAMFDAAPFNARAEPPLRADVAVDRLRMRGDAVLENARVSVVTAQGALRTLVAEGRSPGAGPGAFSLALGPRTADPSGAIRFRADDAGFAVRALTGADNIIGGVASADGAWRAGPPSVARFDIRIRDYEVVRAPALARLVSSIGSLTGLAEALNGDGIGFALLEAQVVYAEDRITFTEGRMSGPSLGLTGSGAYQLTADNLDVDGVVVPSPALNLSFLSEVPLIGDLLASRRGEGMFAMTYALNGPVAAPRVGVNPMSVMAPGTAFQKLGQPQPASNLVPESKR
ncbi:MAG TPA: AsmA-like C-terminal region-containing protein, partial [Terricaulis sp.]|nr:AsmA-like C-terminal region-containing protein [Terricaulis sp.]